MLARRKFLTTLGASAALLPFLPLRNSSAQELGIPKRLLLWFTPHGTVHENWVPQGSATQFTLGPILASLQPFVAKLSVLDGVAMDPGKFVVGHQGFPSLWTGSPRDFAGDGTCQNIGWGESIDQAVAQVVGKGTAYQSLELGCHSMPGSNCTGNRMIFRGPKQPVSPSEDPTAIYKRLFGTALGPSDAALRRDERRSELDSVLSELMALRARAPAAEKPKLDAHLEAIRSIEKRLSIAPATCQAPALGEKLDYNKSANMGKMLDLQSDLLAAAFACDLTRVASSQIAIADNDGGTYDFLGVNQAHHGISHLGDSDTNARANLTKIYTFYAERFAYLLKRLDSIPEGDGSVLDHSVVVWGSEIGKGNTHSFDSLPFVVAGGAAGALKTGQFLRFNKGAAYHNQLLVSLARAMGLSTVTKFGTNDRGAGPLPGLLA